MEGDDAPSLLVADRLRSTVLYSTSTIRAFCRRQDYWQYRMPCSGSLGPLRSFRWRRTKTESRSMSFNMPATQDGRGVYY